MIFKNVGNHSAILPSALYSMERQIAEYKEGVSGIYETIKLARALGHVPTTIMLSHGRYSRLIKAKVFTGDPVVLLYGLRVSISAVDMVSCGNNFSLVIAE